jgi:hypothetical protein
MTTVCTLNSQKPIVDLNIGFCENSNGDKALLEWYIYLPHIMTVADGTIASRKGFLLCSGYRHWDV